MPPIRCGRCKASRRRSNGIDILIGPEGGFAEEERANAAAAAANLAAFAGTADPAGRHRRRSRRWRWCRRRWATGRAGPGRLESRAATGSRKISKTTPCTVRIPSGDSTFLAVIKPSGCSGSKPRPGHAKGCALTSGTRFPAESLDFAMTMTAAPRATGSAAWADALLLSFAQAGYVRAEPDILQPAEPFLDLSGEDIRKSLYLTTDASGEELCLRPDLTIPVARDYLASAGAGQPDGLLLSRAGVPLSRRPAERILAGRHRILRTDRTAPRPMPKCWRWRWRRPPRSG